jgi:hypothetical protein
MTPASAARSDILARTTAAAMAASAPHAVTVRRKRIALAVAAIADAVQLGLFPAFFEGALSPPDDALDVVVAAILLLTLGWRWRLLAALALELVPGVALFPSWTAFVATIPTVSETPAPRPRPELPAAGHPRR